MAAVEKWQEGHDKLCAERYRTIGEGLHDLKGVIASIKTGQNKAVWLAASILIAVVGWMGSQLYGGLQAEIHRSQVAPAAVSTRTGG